ncbi:sugar ABC transporter substrate-binding protein [Marinactinospora thermotolerans]|uniref:Carbohydrate ABC transporter substrate-binding protein, CUT1 family n=1 Tax=Marinactinospora thermotolerans DSM 45154 TaxID=1122192 RepID=A0A1T4LM00_9ACTN|nr:maltose ABC transporter substrate-binding protein [Marinactinospora thermotolerans]SJZ55753.1 carbohydrate ABC transporter substrate-binding protein, CUT1 family [Marinactinospora thermotolerans DSM 45154]
MKIRSAGVFASATVLTLVATACGGGGDSGEAAQEEPSGTMVIWADDIRTKALLPFAEEFGEAHGIQVEVETIPNEDLESNFVTAHQAGSGPDIVVGAHDWTGNFVQNGAIDPVQLPEDKVAAFNETAIEAVTYNGQLYGVPYATENLVLIRNTELAPEAPSSVEELVETGAALKDEGEVEEILGLQVGQEGDPYHIYPFYTSAGGYLFGQDDKGDYDPSDVGVGTPESVAAFERIAELGEKGEGALKRSIDSQNVASLFQDGKTPFFITGPWSIPDVKTAGIDYEISAIPGFEDGEEARPFVGVQTFYVAAGGANKVLAQEFVTNYVTDPELAIALYEEDPRPPALTAALEQVSQSDPDLAKVTEAGANGDPLPAIPQMAAIWDPFGKAEAAVISGEDPEEAVTAAGKAITDQIG